MLNRCDSGTDSTVWMEEDGKGFDFAPWVFIARRAYFLR